MTERVSNLIKSDTQGGTKQATPRNLKESLYLIWKACASLIGK